MTIQLHLSDLIIYGDAFKMMTKRQGESGWHTVWYVEEADGEPNAV